MPYRIVTLVVVEALTDARIPEADKVFMPIALGPDAGVVEIRFDDSDDIELMSEIRPAASRPAGQ